MLGIAHSCNLIQWLFCSLLFFGLGPRLSRTKTEYMMCDFNATRHEGGDVSLDGQVVVEKDTFRYLGLVLQRTAPLMKMLGIEFQLAD